MNSKVFLENLKDVPFIFEAQLSLFTTYRVGGAAEVLALPDLTLDVCKEFVLTPSTLQTSIRLSVLS